MRMYHVVILLIVVLTCFGSVAAGSDESAQTETLSVSLGNIQGPARHPAAGILHSLAPGKPAKEFVLPLNITTLRMKPYASSYTVGAIDNCPLAKEIGAQIMLLLSDKTSYGGHGWWPGDDGDWSQWEETVRGQIEQALETDCDYVYEIWNEPDIPPFWSPEGTTEEKVERFFETWKRAYHVIREMVPDGLIVGPSVAYFDYPVRSMFNLEEFLIFARENDVLPDILSWHEGWKPDTVEPRVEYIRAFMEEYDIEIPHISINEYGGLYDQFAPGVFVQYFAALERAGVVSGVKTCWPERQGGISNCWKASLAGLTTYPDRKPRASWWAYKGYADVKGQLLEVIRSETVDGLAGFDSDSEQVVILLGRDSKEFSPVALKLEQLDQRRELLGAFGQIRVVGYRIPSNGKDELEEMVKEFDETILVGGSELNIELPDFGKTDAYVIKLLNPDMMM